MRKAFLLLFVLTLAPVGAGKAQRRVDTVSQRAKAFREIEGFTGEPLGSLTTVDFAIRAGKVRLRSDGRGTRYAAGTPARSFRLLTDGGEIARVYICDYRGDVLLLYEVDAATSGQGFIARLDGRTSMVEWTASVPGFNVGRGLLEGGYAFVTAIGFVGKLDLGSGRYVWRLDDLYQDRAFNSFDVPRVTENVVSFSDVPELSDRPAVTLDVDKRTGKIVNISPPVKLIRRRRGAGEYGGVADHR